MGRGQSTGVPRGSEDQRCCLGCYRQYYTRTWGIGIDPFNERTKKYPRPLPCKICEEPTNWFLFYKKHPPKGD